MNCLDWHNVTMHDVTIAEMALRSATREGDADLIAYRTQRLADVSRAYAQRLSRLAPHM